MPDNELCTEQARNARNGTETSLRSPWAAPYWLLIKLMPQGVFFSFLFFSFLFFSFLFFSFLFFSFLFFSFLFFLFFCFLFFSVAAVQPSPSTYLNSHSVTSNSNDTANNLSLHVHMNHLGKRGWLHYDIVSVLLTPQCSICFQHRSISSLQSQNVDFNSETSIPK